MRVMNQGADYEEDTTTSDLNTEGEEDTSASIGKIAGIPVKVLIIGGAVLLLLVLFVVIFGSRKSDDDIVVPNQMSTPQTQVSNTSQSDQFYSWYTSDGAYLGTSLGMSDGTTITDEGVEVAIISSAGNIRANTSSGVTVNVNLTQSAIVPDVTQETSVSSGAYDNSQIETLRKLGYTGDEIEIALSNNLDYDTLVENAQALRDAEALDAIMRMSDHESDEFKYLLNYSIFHFPRREFTPRNGEPVGYNQQGSYIVNADYEKLDTYGLQLLIKIKIANGTFAYMPITPERWETLPDTGNIVVQVYYVRYGTVDTNDVYITNIVEQDITHITVNPEDSTIDFEDMTALTN